MRLHVFKERLLEIIDIHIEGVGAGQCQDYAAYREQVGYLRGMRECLLIAEEVEKGIDD